MKGHSPLITPVLHPGENDDAGTGLRIKWCLLRNAKSFYYGGLTWILLFPLYFMVLPLLFGITPMIAVALSFVMLIMAGIVCISYYHIRLYRVVDGLSAPFMVDGIDLLRVKIAITDGARVYTIEFHDFP